MAGLQITAPEGTDANAHQLADAQAETGKHLAHLALETLFQHHAGAAGRQTGHVLGLGLPLRDAYTLEQLQQHAAVKCLIERDPVFLFYAAARVGNVLGEYPIVGENQQPLAVGIQSPGIVGVAVFGRQQVIDRADGTLSLTAANVAARLVEQDGHFLLGRSVTAVHLHEVGRHHTQSGGVHFLAVDLYAPFLDETVGSAAGFIPAGGQKLVEAHAPLRCGRVGILFCHNLCNL